MLLNLHSYQAIVELEPMPNTHRLHPVAGVRIKRIAELMTALVSLGIGRSRRP